MSIIREAEAAALEEQARIRGPNRQIGMRFTAEFRVPREPNLSQVDAWLAALPHGGDWSDLPRTSTGRGEMARLWLGRCLRLAVSMAQAARLPMFEAPRLTSCLPTRVRGDSWRAQFELPRVDGVPRPVLESVLTSALTLTNWMAANPMAADARKVFFGYVQSRVLDLIARHGPFDGSIFETLRVANRLGIPFRLVSAGVYQLGWGAKACLIDRSGTCGDSGVNLKLAQGEAATARLLGQLVAGTGRIPVEVFVGGKAAWLAARARQAELACDGLQTVLTNADTTLDAQGRPMIMPHGTLFDRTCALILSRQVQGLILVVQSGEFLRSGLPLELVDRVEMVDDGLVEHDGSGKPLTDVQRTRLERLLAGWTRH